MLTGASGSSAHSLLLLSKETGPGRQVPPHPGSGLGPEAQPQRSPLSSVLAASLSVSLSESLFKKESLGPDPVAWSPPQPGSGRLLRLLLEPRAPGAGHAQEVAVFLGLTGIQNPKEHGRILNERPQTVASAPPSHSLPSPATVTSPHGAEGEKVTAP